MYSDADKVFLIQKRGIRTVVNLSYRDSCRTLLKTYSVFSSYEVFIFETFCFAYNHENAYSIANYSYEYYTHANNYLLPATHKRQ